MVMGHTADTEITYLELSRALVGLWLPSHCEEALIALFGMRPVSIPSAWKHMRNMASSGKKETHVLRICTNDSHKPFSFFPTQRDISTPPPPAPTPQMKGHITRQITKYPNTTIDS